MALRNGEVGTSPKPSYEVRIGNSLKIVTTNGDDVRTAYSYLLFYIWNKTDEQRFCHSYLNTWMDEISELISVVNIDPELCGSFFKCLEEKRNQDIEKVLTCLDLELISMIKGCNEWLERNCFEEMEPYKFQIFHPLYLYIDLLKITRAGIAAFFSGLWHIHSEHRSILRSIDYQSDLDFSKINV